MSKARSGGKAAQDSDEKPDLEVPDEIREAGAEDKIGSLELLESLYLPHAKEACTAEEVFVTAIRRLRDLKPKDAVEKMLAAQMMGVHAAAMHCLQAAAVPGQTFHSVDMRLKHAGKLLSLFTRQLEALDKHRGKGQQKVTVEYVNVESGGQAVVGHVEGGRTQRKGKARKRRRSPKQIESKETVPFEMTSRESAPISTDGDERGDA